MKLQKNSKSNDRKSKKDQGRNAQNERILKYSKHQVNIQNNERI